MEQFKINQSNISLPSSAQENDENSALEPKVVNFEYHIFTGSLSQLKFRGCQA